MKNLLRVGRLRITPFGSATDCKFSLRFVAEEVRDRALGREEDGSGYRKTGRGGAWVA